MGAGRGTDSLTRSIKSIGETSGAETTAFASYS